MKAKFLLISTLILGLIGLGALTWSLLPTTGQAETAHNHEEHAHGHGNEEPLEDLFGETAKPNSQEEHASHAEHGPEPYDHDRQGEHEDHAGHVKEDAHDEDVVRLSAEELSEFGIALKQAGPGLLAQQVELPGEIVLNSDRLAHVVPRVTGIVREVRKSLGDQTRTGEVLAVIDSRELAEVKAAFLAARERRNLAQAKFEREARLWEKQVTSEQEYLDARQAFAEARIELNSAEQQLHALGLSDTYLRELPVQPDVTYTRYEILAPFAGTIIEKHLTLGENVNADANVFTIADLSLVWVDINVYQKDLPIIRQGQEVEIEIGHGIPTVTGGIAWVGPLVGEETRTAQARVVLPNPDGMLRPGLFVTAKVAVARNNADIVVPKTALQTFEERSVVFVRGDEGFKPRPVTIGRQNDGQVEILSGLKRGETYVSKGAFTLKAQLSKGAFGDGHNH